MKDGRRFGRPPDPYQPPAVPQRTVNLTDPDSRLLKGLRGWLQGYNAQALCNDRQIVLAAEISLTVPDFGNLEPMLDAAKRELQGAGIDARPETVLADAGYWHQPQMERLVAAGTQVLIPPDSGKRRGSRPGWNGGFYNFMRSVLDTELGGGLYRRRQQLIEPVFANTKHNRGITRPSGSQSRISGGIKNDCSRSHATKRCAIHQVS